MNDPPATPPTPDECAKAIMDKARSGPLLALTPERTEEIIAEHIAMDRRQWSALVAYWKGRAAAAEATLRERKE